MEDLFSRQAAMIRELIAHYRDGSLSLNTLIQRLEGITDAIDSDSWREAVFPIVLAMEQVNAYTLETKANVSEKNKTVIDESLRDLEIIIGHYK